jgi:hypothetical protein
MEIKKLKTNEQRSCVGTFLLCPVPSGFNYIFCYCLARKIQTLIIKLCVLFTFKTPLSFILIVYLLNKIKTLLFPYSV